MQDNEFETPQAAPTGAASPISRAIEYKPGKVPESYVKMSSPEIAKAGFRYWDSEAETLRFIENPVFYILARCSRVAGAIPDANDRYRNFFSNLVFDTRTDIISLREQGMKAPLYSGLFKDVKEYIAKEGLKGVGHQTVFVCYCPQLDQIVSIPIGSVLEKRVIQSISAASNVKPERVSLYALNSLTTQIWALVMTGQYEGVEKDGNPYNGKGDMFYAPVMSAGVITSTGKRAEFFAELAAMQQSVVDYLDATQKRLQDFQTGSTYPNENKNAPVQENALPLQHSMRNESFGPSAGKSTNNIERNESASFPTNPPPSQHFDDLPF
jgi:hypothetical protein